MLSGGHEKKLIAGEFLVPGSGDCQNGDMFLLVSCIK